MGIEYYSSKKKSGKNIKKIILLLFLGSILFSLFIGGRWLYKNREQFLFYFEENKHIKLLKKIGSIEDIAKKDLNFEKLDRVIQFEKLIDKLSKNQYSDGYLAYLKGKLNYLKFQSDVKKNQSLLWELFFYAYLDRYKFPVSLRKDIWQKAIISLRRALVLKLPQKNKNECKQYLANLYLWGGKSYWNLGLSLLEEKNDKDNVFNSFISIYHFYNILLQTKIPDWSMLKAEYSTEIISFWEVIYYLKSGNIPRAYSLLNHLIQLKQTNDIQGQSNSRKTLFQLNRDQMIQIIKNNSLYLLGHQMKKEKKLKNQYYYYSQIDHSSFLKRNKWFLEEYHFLLRFLGKNNEASQFLLKYEKKTN